MDSHALLFPLYSLVLAHDSLIPFPVHGNDCSLAMIVAQAHGKTAPYVQPTHQLKKYYTLMIGSVTIYLSSCFIGVFKNMIMACSLNRQKANIMIIH